VTGWLQPAGEIHLAEGERTMAMKMNGEVALPADRETVWVKLNDPEVLKICIPGCQDLEKIGDTAFSANVKIKVGPISATFKSNVTLNDLDPPNGYRISGEGEGGVAGFAKGGVLVKLTEPPAGHGGCILTYEVSADVGGKIAQLGARMMDSVAKKMADQFFTAFATAVSAAPAGTV
jgi:carbon monoxide dehydrogenase subunit G